MNAKEEIMSKTPVGTNYRILPYIYEAMDIHAKQKAWELWKHMSELQAQHDDLAYNESQDKEHFEWYWKENNK